MRSVCCGTQNSMLMFVCKEDTDDILNPITGTCSTSWKSLKNQHERAMQMGPGHKSLCEKVQLVAEAGLWPMLGWAFFLLRSVNGAPTLVPARDGMSVGQGQVGDSCDCTNSLWRLLSVMPAQYLS